MEILYALVFIALLFAAAKALSFLNRRRVTPSFAPTNDLEHLMVASIGAVGISSTMRQQLMSATLLALESEDDPDTPMTFSATFPAEFAGALRDPERTGGREITFGPWVVCFSSRDIVEGLADHRVMGVLVTQMGNVRPFPARRIFQSALEHRVDVVLNPFFGVSRRFTQDEIQSLINSPSTDT